MFMRVTSTCAEQVRPPLSQDQGRVRGTRNLDDIPEVALA
jgi:hypothetical protein